MVKLRCFSVARCQTPSGGRLDGFGWVLLGPKRARQGPGWSRMGPYISRTLMQDSRVICRGSSGPIGPYRVPTGFCRNTDLARRDSTWLDGSLDCPVSVHNCCTNPLTPRRPHGPSGAPSEPTDPRRTAGGTVGPRLIGASPVWAARSSYWRSQCSCNPTNLMKLLGAISKANPCPGPVQWTPTEASTEDEACTCDFA